MAASVHATETPLSHTLPQLAAILLAGRAGGALAQRLGQAAVVGEMLVGVLLGRWLSRTQAQADASRSTALGGRG
jgi:Kef-type K+ transport system membrane component KefB